MNRLWIMTLGLCACAAAAGCSGSSKKHKSPDLLARMIYSPSGEPLNGGALGRPTCPDALGKWFDRLDAAHTGAVSRETFLADAKLQFGRMDIDKNGYLVSEEVERFRLPYRQQGANAVYAGDRKAESSGQGQRGHGQHAATGKSHEENPPFDEGADPVMSADTNLDFKVTPEEFMAHAQKTFDALDSDHNGVLSREEVVASCPKATQE